MTTHTTTADRRAEQLRGLCGGAVHLPGDPGYDAARTPWNRAVDQRPAAVAHPAMPRTCPPSCVLPGCGLPRRATGHNTGPLAAAARRTSCPCACRG
jgi:hypothetical protein